MTIDGIQLLAIKYSTKWRTPITKFNSDDLRHIAQCAGCDLAVVETALLVDTLAQ